MWGDMGRYGERGGEIASVSGVDTRKASASHSSAATYRAAGRRVRFGRGGGWPCAYLYGTPFAAAQLGHENSDIASLSAFETPTHGPWYHRSHASQPIMNLDVVAASLPVQKQQACGGQHSQSSHQGAGVRPLAQRLTPAAACARGLRML